MTTATSSSPTVMSRVGGFLNGVGSAFRDGWHHVRNGEFGKMDIGQWLAMGVTTLLAFAVVKSLAEMIWEEIRDYVPWVLGAIALLAGVFLLGKLFGSAGKDDAARPDPAREGSGAAGMKTSALEPQSGQGIAPEVKKLAMREVDSTRMALLDPQVASGLSLNDLAIRDELPKRATDEQVTGEARRALAMLG